MIQLSYQPAFDPFHAVFRNLRLLTFLPERATDTFRILDFYLLFPFRIKDIRLKPAHRNLKKIAKSYAIKKPYGEQPDDKILFDRMKPMQTAAMETLASHRLIEKEKLSLGSVMSTGVLVPDNLRERIDLANEKEKDLVEFLKLLATQYELTGDDGLKARTKLLEHRYDAV